MNGVIIVDKPSGWTSHDLVNRMRRILGQRSVGHLGTLDPLATGVLPLVAGSLTRLAQFYTASEKIYEGVIRFGFATDTYDAEGEATTPPQQVNITLEQLHDLAAEFTGTIQQTPPPFSAKKIQGVPAYKLARKHKEVTLQPVEVEIKEFSITGIDNDCASFHAHVTSGTYMRSVAHEMGQRLSCGAHLKSLRRTAVAEFDISQAHTLEEIEAAQRGHSEDSGRLSQGPAVEDGIAIKGCHSESIRRIGEETAIRDSASTLERFFIHPRQLLPQFPSVTADEAIAARIRNGRTVNLPELSQARQVKVFSGQRELLAIATRVAGTLFHPKIVFAGSATE